MIEKKLKAVSAQLFTSNGTANGRLTIADASLFKVKQKVIVYSNTVPSYILEVHRIDDANTMYLGSVGTHIDDRVNLSALLAADSASIKSDLQQRPSIPEEQIERLTYEEEPVVARRVTIVDRHGDKISSSNPLPVAATVVLTSVGTPNLFNVLCPTTGIEYSQLLPNNTAQLQIRSRNSQAKLQLSWIPGTTSTTFLTITPGTIYTLENVILGNRTVYFNSSKDSTIVEILTWS